jgi:hypothetical protein
MIALIGDAALRRRVRAGGAAWVGQRFAVDLVSQRAMEIYAGVLSGASDAEAEVPDRLWLEAMLARGLGRRRGRADELAFRLVHTPAIYRAYLALARGRGA